MLKFSLLILGLLIAAPLALMATLWLAVEDRPRIDRKVILTPEHVGRAKGIIDRHRRSVRPGTLAVAKVISADADLAANYLASRFGNGSAQLTIADRSAIIRLSLPMASTGLSAMSGYLNVEGTLVQTDGLPRLRSVRVGRLPLPNALIEVLALRFEDWLRHSPEYRSAFEALRQIKMSGNELTVVYRWMDAFPNEMRASIIDEHERARLFRYHSLLASSSAEQGGTVSLGTILSLLARAPAAPSSADAIADNRAIILVTTFHVLGITLEKLLPEAANWPRSPSQTVTLDGREDFAKHFMVSAAVTAFADTALADAIGLYKEIDDARYGSGFSFNDIAADRAGTKFGEKAVSNEDSAEDMQRRIASGLEDSDLMPKWDDLPEYLSEADFKRRFTDIASPAYRGMMQKIEQRVAGLRVLH
jgi:hypothetical protein